MAGFIRHQKVTSYQFGDGVVIAIEYKDGDTVYICRFESMGSAQIVQESSEIFSREVSA